jgi:hypothetical protein
MDITRQFQEALKPQLFEVEKSAVKVKRQV